MGNWGSVVTFGFRDIHAADTPPCNSLICIQQRKTRGFGEILFARDPRGSVAYFHTCSPHQKNRLGAVVQCDNHGCLQGRGRLTPDYRRHIHLELEHTVICHGEQS